MVLFTALAVMLKPLLFDPMLKLFDEREKRIEGAKLEARKTDDASAQALSEILKTQWQQHARPQVPSAKSFAPKVKRRRTKSSPTFARRPRRLSKLAAKSRAAKRKRFAAISVRR